MVHCTGKQTHEQKGPETQAASLTCSGIADKIPPIAGYRSATEFGLQIKGIPCVSSGGQQNSKKKSKKSTKKKKTQKDATRREASQLLRGRE